jgi:hypothetical protein
MIGNPFRNCFSAFWRSAENLFHVIRHPLLNGENLAVEKVHDRSELSNFLLALRLEKAGTLLSDFCLEGVNLNLSFGYFGSCLICFCIRGYVERVGSLIGEFEVLVGTLRVSEMDHGTSLREEKSTLVRSMSSWALAAAVIPSAIKAASRLARLARLAMLAILDSKDSKPGPCNEYLKNCL